MMVRTRVMKPKFPGSRVRKFSDFKENNVLLARREPQKGSRDIRRMEVEYTYIRNKIKLRAQHYENTLSKLEEDCDWYKSCLLKLIDMVDESNLVIQLERRENMELLQQLEAGVFHCNEGLKTTQTVSPMVSGLPLKRASITLKRLNPFHLQQRSRELSVNTNGSSHVPQSPESEPEMEEHSQTPSVVVSPRGDSSPEMISTPAQQVLGPPSRRKSNIQRLPRCGLCHEVSSSVVPLSHSTPQRTQQDIHLKRASIHLTRLDPRSYLCHEGIKTELHGSRALREDLDDESVSEVKINGISSEEEEEEDKLSVVSAHSENIGPDPPVRFSFSKEPGRRNLDDLSPGQSPMVVLERLERYEYFGNVNDSQSPPEIQRVYTAPASVFSSFENKMCQSAEKMCNENTSLEQACSSEDIVEISPSRASSPQGNSSPPRASSPQGNSSPPRASSPAVSTVSAASCVTILHGKRKPLVTLVDVRGIYGNADCVKIKRLDGENKAPPQNLTGQAGLCNENVEEKRPEPVVPKVSNPPECDRVYKHKKPNSVLCDQDPLEGPSWLYNGKKTPSEIIKYKKRRKPFPVMYIDESSDDSMDETDYKKPRKEKKRGRKKKVNTRLFTNPGIHIAS